MSKILEFSVSEPRLGLRTRRTTPGPELDLVADFVRNHVVQMFEADSSVAIFQEPALPSGFPDLVVAEFRADAYATRARRRASLGKSHLKLLQHLYMRGPLDVLNTAAQLGQSTRGTARLVQDLLDCGLVIRDDRMCSVRVHRDSFGISRLIAIEAKIDNWKSAFRQSVVNQWFASEAYVVYPGHRLLPRTLERSDALNIGILSSTSSGFEVIRTVQPGALPTSWVSWQFNEWLARRLITQEGFDA